jgi:hypothetical protein
VHVAGLKNHAWTTEKVLKLTNNRTTHFPVFLAANMLPTNSMNMVFLEVIVGMLVFSAGNVAYFEIRRLIQGNKPKFDKSKLSRAHTPRHATLHTSDLK